MIRKKFLLIWNIKGDKMRGEQKPSREAHFTRYSVRAIKRVMGVLFYLFLLFLVVMGLIWIVPKVWQMVMG